MAELKVLGSDEKKLKKHPLLAELVDAIEKADPIAYAEGDNGTPYAIIYGGGKTFTFTQTSDGYHLKAE